MQSFFASKMFKLIKREGVEAMKFPYFNDLEEIKYL